MNLASEIPFIWNALGLVLVMALLFFIIVVFRKFQERLTQQSLEHQQTMTEESLKIQEQEREKLAADLHDDLVSQINLLRLQNRSGSDQEELDTQISNLLKHTREISHGLFPPMLDTVTLEDLMTDYLDGFKNYISVNIERNLRAEAAFNQKQKLHIFRIYQEVLSNAFKHAQARGIELRIRSTQAYFIWSLRDDGLGLPNQVTEGLGFQSIKMRSQELRAHYHYKRLKKGTIFIFCLPQTQNAKTHPTQSHFDSLG